MQGVCGGGARRTHTQEDRAEREDSEAVWYREGTPAAAIAAAAAAGAGNWRRRCTHVLDPVSCVAF